jgi:carboxylesterase
MRYLGERLHGAGFTVAGVRLAGHASSVEELESCRWQDWYASVESGLAELRRSCSAVAAVGLSLGSLLVLRLAHAEPAVSCLALLSTALVLTNPWPARLAAVGRLVVPLLPSRLRYVDKGVSDIADPEARAVHPGYRRMPLRSVLQLIALERQVRALLPEIAQPAIAIQARHDHTTPASNLAILQSGLPHLRETVLLAASSHVITVDVERQRVANEVLRFICSVLGSPGSAVVPVAPPVSAGTA